MTWLENVPLWSDMFKDMDNQLFRQYSEFSTRLAKYHFVTESSGASAGERRYSLDSVWDGGGRAYYGAASSLSTNLSSTSLLKTLEGRLHVNSTDSRLYAYTALPGASGVSEVIPLGGTRMVLADCGSAATANECYVMMIGESPERTDASESDTTHVSFNASATSTADVTPYEAAPFVLISSQISDGVKLYTTTLATVDASGFTVTRTEHGNPALRHWYKFMWMSIGTAPTTKWFAS